MDVHFYDGRRLIRGAAEKRPCTRKKHSPETSDYGTATGSLKDPVTGAVPVQPLCSCHGKSPIEVRRAVDKQSVMVAARINLHLQHTGARLHQVSRERRRQETPCPAWRQGTGVEQCARAYVYSCSGVEGCRTVIVERLATLTEVDAADHRTVIVDRLIAAVCENGGASYIVHRRDRAAVGKGVITPIFEVYPGSLTRAALYGA